MKSLNRKSGLIAIACLAGTLTISQVANADITLQDDNSVATVNPDDMNNRRGMNSWQVDGVNQLFQQWFWVRLEGWDNEVSLDALTLDAAVATDTNASGFDNNLYLRYIYSGQLGALKIEVNFALDGGVANSLNSDIAEQITLTNIGDSALDIYFFQYSDFDLGTTLDDTVILSAPNTVSQTDAGGTFAMNETVVTPMPDLHELDTFSSTRTRLDDMSATTLDDANSMVGPADVTWAFEWDITLGARDSFQISKDKQITPVPAPGAALLGMLGFGMVRWVRRRVA